MSVHWPIIRRLLFRPLAHAVVDDRGPRRGIELLLAALHAASAIERAGSSRTVGVLLPTGAGFPVAALAAWSLGRTVVPLNYLLKRDELEYIITDSGADTVVTAGPMLEFMGYEPSGARLLRLETLDFKSAPEPRLPARAEHDDLAVLLYTSGTSGKPKGVMLSHGNLRANMSQIFRYANFSRHDVMLGVLPQFHSFGMTALTLLPLAAGMKVIYTARFVPQKIVRLLREHRPTFFVGIPSMYGALLSVKDAAPDDFASLRFAVSGGEPLSGAVADEFHQRFGVRIAEGYGLTETSPVTNVCLPEEYRRASVGRALPDIEERIVDPATGRSLPVGSEGEIWIKGPNVMKGYFGLPDETAKALTPDGFLRTGDMGKLDPDGFLYITGRIKEMLIIAGENVFPREIEEVLDRHPAVAASGVVGIPDPVRGELPLAFVELKEGAAFDKPSIIAHCRANLAGYKVPTDVRHLDALPRSPTGKVLRRALKASLA
ncbi:MAG: AMP-binding protein [Phycisphaeraceae bacterium]|nr:MAG: AMP-binding protein [Phycisphaeraceae bacterium]